MTYQDGNAFESQDSLLFKKLQSRCRRGIDRRYRRQPLDVEPMDTSTEATRSCLARSDLVRRIPHLSCRDGVRPRSRHLVLGRTTDRRRHIQLIRVDDIVGRTYRKTQ